jgi:hypothetical protein
MAGSLGGRVVALATIAWLFYWGVRADSLGLLAVASIGTVQVVPSVIVFSFGSNVAIAIPVALLTIGAALVTTAVVVARRPARHESTKQDTL